jgi:hypothetical protein
MARQKRQTNHVGFRATEEMLAFLRARRKEDESLGAAARCRLEFYQALLACGIQALELSQREALRILEALNGILITPETTPSLWTEMA